MTDGRAITGMTADSCEHARTPARIFPHFSPQEFQFLRIATSRFPKSNSQAELSLSLVPFPRASANRRYRYLRDFSKLLPVSLFLSLYYYDDDDPRRRAALSTAVYDPFDLLYERLASYPFQARLLNNCRLPARSFRFLSLSDLFSLSAPPPPPGRPHPTLSAVRHRIQHDWEYVSASGSRRTGLYDRLEFQFLGGQNASVIGRQDVRGCSRSSSRGRTKGFCAAVHAVNSRDHSRSLARTHKRNRSSRGSRARRDRGVKIEGFYKFKGQLRANGIG